LKVVTASSRAALEAEEAGASGLGGLGADDAPFGPPTSLDTARRRRRPRHLERTRRDILEATFDVVSSAGYHGSRIEEICRLAGVSRGAFYHHFASKEAAIVALIERNLDQLLEERARIERATVDDRVRMVALELATIMRWVGSGSKVARAYFVEMAGVTEVEALHERLARQFEVHLRETLEPLFRTGELVTSDLATTCRAFVGMTKEAAAAFVLGRVPELGLAIREVVRLALLGVGVRPERADALAEEAAAYHPQWSAAV
jgi:AcrR family transcriptional regulator